jgi:hypothetical protein
MGICSAASAAITKMGSWSDQCDICPGIVNLKFFFYMCAQWFFIVITHCFVLHLIILLVGRGFPNTHERTQLMCRHDADKLSNEAGQPIRRAGER